jgi:hypothetical protein
MDEFPNYSFLVDYIEYILLAGYLLCACGLAIFSFKSKSFLLKVGAVCFFLCAFSAVASMIYPLRMHLNMQSGRTTTDYRPNWVSRMQAEGSPLLLLLAGVSILGFAVRSKPNNAI